MIGLEVNICYQFNQFDGFKQSLRISPTYPEKSS